jgi:type I restriction enzyme S subunit
MEGKELPVGWLQAPVDDLGDLRLGKMLDKSKNQGIPVKYLRNINVRWFSFETDDLLTLLASPDEIEKLSIADGDLLICEGGEPGRCAVWRGGPNNLVYQKALHRFRSYGGIIPELLMYSLRNEAEQGILSESFTGSTIKHLTRESLARYNVSVAPLIEQRRIVAKLDTTLAAVDACRQRLDGVAAILKRFRQAVLAAATSGELTREWREENDAPEWELLKAADVCDKVQSGGTPKMGFIEEPGVPFLKVYNLVNQSVDFGYRPQYVEPEAHLGPLAKSRTLPGDVLMNIVGPPLGKVAIVPDAHDEWNINQAICLFRPSRRVATEWLYYLLCEGANIRQIQLETKGSAGQVNISLTQCRQFEFPVPSIDEQQEISRRTQELFTLADQLEARLTAARKVVDRLTPALLAKAFRGELVPQDPNDEPASVLLERIRAARQAEAATGKPSRRGRPKAAANPASSPVDAAPVTPDRLATLLRECGALSERALLAASELDPAGFRAQLAHERSLGAIGNLDDDGQELLEAVG